MTVNAATLNISEEALREITEEDASVVVERDGQPVAVLVSPRLLKVLREFKEELEDRLDLEAYREAKREAAESGEQPVSYEEFRKELGL